MAPSTPASSGFTLTPREQEVLLTAGQCFLEEPKLDMEKFMTLAGFASKASASNAWRNIRVKLGLAGSPAKRDSPAKKEKAAPVTPAKRGRKRKAKEQEESDDEGFGEESPSREKRVKVEPKEEGEADVGDDED